MNAIIPIIAGLVQLAKQLEAVLISQGYTEAQIDTAVQVELAATKQARVTAEDRERGKVESR